MNTEQNSYLNNENKMKIKNRRQFYVGGKMVPCPDVYEDWNGLFVFYDPRGFLLRKSSWKKDFVHGVHVNVFYEKFDKRETK